MKINKEELKKDGKKIYKEGYRVVYFYDDKYEIAEYCKTIEGFMIGLCECDPIIDEDDVPPFISTEDLLRRSLSFVEEAKGAALYNIDGTLIDELYR